MSDLVDRLCAGDHQVEFSVRPERTAAAVKECLDRGYVHIKFPNTKGGTELGVRLDPSTDLSDADFDNHRGQVKVRGDLTLDYVKVRCIADIDLATFCGMGHLERREL